MAELAFFDECPTSWDKTVALSGAIGMSMSSYAMRRGAGTLAP
jgi:hypothetical protein